MDPSNPLPQLPARAGTIGGTLLTVLLQISGPELARTVVMAATGAAVSFLVSFALQRALRKRKPK